jgi:hypothetical protein
MVVPHIYCFTHKKSEKEQLRKGHSRTEKRGTVLHTVYSTTHKNQKSEYCTQQTGKETNIGKMGAAVLY